MNKAEAVNWYKLAASGGNKEAQCNLGVCYQLKWYKLSAGQENMIAQYNLGSCFVADDIITDVVRKY